jgi:hypothetical protein
MISVVFVLACAWYSAFLERERERERDKLLMQNLLKDGYVFPKLMTSLQTLYGRQHGLVDRKAIAIAIRRLFFSLSPTETFSGLDYE